MDDTQSVIEQIREAFRETDHPGDAFLQGSQDGCEPGEVIAPFKGLSHWTQIDPSILDPNYTALSFFSEGGFRHFLPAFLIADLEGRLQTADPLFHLISGFSGKVVKVPVGSRVFEKIIGKSGFVNPRRYGAMTWHDYARSRLSIFTREEACAIVAYLHYKLHTDSNGLDEEKISSALQEFWNVRAHQAPTQEDLRRHIQAESDYLDAIGGTP